MKINALIATLLALLLLATACGSDDDDAVAESAETAAEATAAEPEAEQAAADEEMAEQAAAEVEAAPAAETEAASELDGIISLSPTATEMLFAIGAGDQVVAVDDFSNYPPEAPTSALSGFQPNVEAIAEFAPAIVVSQSPIEGLDALGIENLVLPAAASFDDVYSQIEQLGAATGTTGDAAELVLQMQTDIDALVAGLPERDVPLTYYHELDPTYFSVTSSTFVGEVYTLLGLENAADAADPDGAAFGYPQLSEEYLIGVDPDLIFLADTKCCEQNAAAVAVRPGWDQLRAVQAGNIVELDDDIASRWGPRLVDFIEVVAGAIAEVETADAG